MSNRDYKTTRLQDHRTTDGAAAHRDQRSVVSSQWSLIRLRWSVVPPTRTYGAAGSGQWSTRRRRAAFTLTELLVTMGVLVVLVLLFTQVLNSAATITTLGHKRMDEDSQGRQLLDRMAFDFNQMLKRSDVDYYVKMPGNSEPGNDQIAFFSAVSGYYPSSSNQSPLSLVGYRVNSDTTSAAYNKLERLGKGLLWNGVSTNDTAIVFLPLTISATWPAACYPLCTSDTSYRTDPAYEVIGSDVFRFEYYYLLKGQVVSGTTYNSVLTDTPWDTRIPGHTSISGMKDVAAIVVAIAVIDPKSKVLLGNSDIVTLASTLIDYGASAAAGCPVPDWLAPGELIRQWQCVLDGTNGLPRPAISGIRLYERYFYLNQ